MGIWLWLWLGCAVQPAADPTIVERPLLWDAERERLTAEYARIHTGPEQGTRITPRMVVLHGTTDPDLDAVVRRFSPSRLPDSRGDLVHAGAVNVSTHYAIDLTDLSTPPVELASESARMQFIATDGPLVWYKTDLDAPRWRVIGIRIEQSR